LSPTFLGQGAGGTLTAPGFGGRCFFSSSGRAEPGTGGDGILLEQNKGIESAVISYHIHRQKF
jgi:hypothetical protein